MGGFLESARDFLEAARWKRLLPSVVAGFLLSAIPQVRNVASWGLTKGLRVEAESSHGSAKTIDYVLVRPQDDSEVAIRPSKTCLPEEVDCYLAVKVTLWWVTEVAVVGSLLSSLFFMGTGLVLRRRSVPELQQIDLDIEIDDDEIASHTVRYTGLLPANPKARLRVPVKLKFTEPKPANNDTVGVISLNLVEKSDPRATITPPLAAATPVNHYQGEIEFGEDAGLPANCALTYAIARNFCLNLETLQARWNTQGNGDDYNWRAFAECKNVNITFRWPANFRLAAEPTVHVHEAGKHPKPRPNSWSWEPKLDSGRQVWRLHARDVEVDTVIKFGWTLAPETRKKASVEGPPIPKNPLADTTQTEVRAEKTNSSPQAEKKRAEGKSGDDLNDGG